MKNSNTETVKTMNVVTVDSKGLPFYGIQIGDQVIHVKESGQKVEGEVTRFFYNQNTENYEMKLVNKDTKKRFYILDSSIG